MIDRAEAVTVSLVKLSLDAAVLRHQVLADNIANANTQHFARGRVSFDAQLAAVRDLLRSGGEPGLDALRGLQPVVEREAPRAEPRGAAELDAEVAEMSENAVHFQSLIRVLGRHMAILSTAVNQGRR